MRIETVDPGRCGVTRLPAPCSWLCIRQGMSSCTLFPLAGLDAGKIKQVGVICGQESTRRIGDYKVKYGYTDIDLLR